MRNNWLWACVVLGLLACSSDQPPAARVALDKTLPDSPLARMQNVSLLAAGDGFVLAGYEVDKIRWARVSKEGVLANETGFALAPAPMLGPYFAVSQKAAPADQLVVVGLYPSTPASNGYELRAVAQNLNATTAEASVLIDTLPAETDTSTVQIAAGAALSGDLGFVAWGTKSQGTPIKYQLFGPDAQPTSATPRTVFAGSSPDQRPAWDCLAAVSGPTGMSFGAITPYPSNPQYSDWSVFDLNAAGELGAITYGLPTQVTECGIVGSPTSTGGYDMAFRNTPGIGIAFYYPPPSDSDSGSILPYPLAVPAANYGSPAKVPYPAWAAAVGNDITVGLASSSGVHVVRFTYLAVPHGSDLVLRSVNGNIGPVSAWVGPDSVYVTYADLVRESSTTSSVRRYFMAVEAPAELP